MMSMTIAAYALRDFDLTSQITNKDKLVNGIRLTPHVHNDLDIHIFQDGCHVICQNENDIIRVKDSDVLTVADRILSFSKMLETWKDELQALIIRGCTLKNIIDRSVQVMENPILIMDESNVVRAISNHGIGEINSDWDYILENGCVDLDIVQNVFSTPLFRRHVKPEQVRSFYFKPKGAINGAINFRIPSSDGQNYIGGLLVLEGLTPITPAMIQYVTILTDALLLWFKINGGKQAMNSSQEVLVELLASGGIRQEGENMLKNIIESDDGRYTLITAAGQKDSNLTPYLMNLAELLPNSVACIYEGNLIVLTDAMNCERHAAKIAQLIRNEKPSIGISNSFAELKSASTHLLQALVAMEYGGLGISKLDAEIMMRFIANEASRMISGMSIVHPSLSILQSYDAKHQSEYYKTLYVFLLTERNIAASLPLLSIHRNTMIFRLERLKTLIEVDLNDPAVREWLLLSYRVCGIPES